MIQTQSRGTLKDLADDRLGSRHDGASLAFAGPASRHLTDLNQDPDVSARLVATIFWQAYTASPAFLSLISDLDVDLTSFRPEQARILHHGLLTEPRVDLMVFATNYPDSRMETLSSVSVQDDDLVQGWSAFSRHPGFSRATSTAEFVHATARRSPAKRCAGVSLGSWLRLRQRGGQRRRHPTWRRRRRRLECPMCSTRAPSAQLVSWFPTAAAKEAGPQPVSRHPSTPSRTICTPPTIPSTVYVNAVEGTVLVTDVINDAALVRVPRAPLMTEYTLGPLVDVAPGRGTRSSFTGIASGYQKAIVDSCDRHIPWVVDPRIQMTVTTDVVTMEGDSGAALLDAEGHVIGFAYWVGGIVGRWLFSEWIWAQSVFRSLGIL